MLLVRKIDAGKGFSKIVFVGVCLFALDSSKNFLGSKAFAIIWIFLPIELLVRDNIDQMQKVDAASPSESLCNADQTTEANPHVDEEIQIVLPSIEVQEEKENEE